jgi:tetratricopeptide (TPR) repeat protein
LSLSGKTGVVGFVVPAAQTISTDPKADDFLLQDNDKYKKANYQGAITDYDQAIRLNPNLVQAYYTRGYTKSMLGDRQGAILDYQRAIELARVQGNQQVLESATNDLRKLQQ